MPDFTDKLKPAYDGPATLAKERSRSSVSVEELSKHLLSRDDFLDRQARILKVVESEKLFSKRQQRNLSRPERYHLGLARAKLIRRLAKKHNWSQDDVTMAEYLNDEMLPFHLQMSMFITTVREQADEVQQAYWLPKIESYSAIGAYAQSELGHGSNVRGLETTATYDVKAKQFIIHSPHLTASKWWNGSMGRTANHAIVVAQLLLPVTQGASLDGAHEADVKYVSHGPHPFIVQIRDLKTHQPMNGVVVGDIGPKYGYQSMDNGYMLFDNYRVPHSAFLARYSKVDADTGAFSQTGHTAIVYGSLSYVRASIIMHARLILARAVTIAVRYCSIRRQFHDRDASSETGPEMVVLDYPTVQIRVLPLLATLFALHYTGEAMYELYSKNRARIEKGDFSLLSEMHATSSGLKSLCTTYAADGIETCRRALGGHGFGGESGLIQTNQDYLSKPTVEGDNWMITQQTASYLIKKMGASVKDSSRKPADLTDEIFADYLKSSRHEPYEIFSSNSIDDKAIMMAFKRRAAALSYKAWENRTKHKKSWTSMMIELHKLSRAFSEMMLATNFFNALQSSTLSTDLKEIMRNLFRLYSLYTIDTSDPRSFEKTGAVSSSTLDKVSEAIATLMRDAIRPHAVKLVDSWKVPDFLLDSSLGRYDGKVYEDLFDRAHRHNPLNKITFNVDWRSDEIVLGSNDGARHLLAKL